MDHFSQYRTPAMVKQQCEALQLKYPKHFQIVPMAVHTAKLVVVRGTLPVPFKEQIYNIPMAWHLPLVYPDVPPTCQITPTAAMRIAVSSHVNQDGIVTLPTSHMTLCEIADGLIDLFQQHMPVFSAQAPSTASPQKTPGLCLVKPNTQGMPDTLNKSNTLTESNTTQGIKVTQPVMIKSVDPVAGQRRQLEAQLIPMLRQYEHQLDQQLVAMNDTLSSFQQRQNHLQLTLRSMHTIKDQQMHQLASYDTQLTELHDTLSATCDNDVYHLSEASKTAAHQQAIQDTLDHLESRLEEGDVTVDLWLRMVGQLARQEFISKMNPSYLICY